MPVFKRASRDTLTGLQDRKSFASKANKRLEREHREELSAVYLRLLNMGAFNVRNGVVAGDELLKSVAAQLINQVPDHLVGRFSSGSFVALMPTDDVEPLIDGINRGLPSTHDPNGLILKAGYCVMQPNLTLEDAVMRARYAFDDIRFDSPAWSRLFDRGLETAFERRTYVVEHLDEAIARGEIRAYAQPIVRTLTGMICEVEILARWESEEFGFLRPDEFIPELEATQLIHKLDAEVIRLACKQWSEAAHLGIHVPFGINLSRLDFELTDIFAVVRDAMSTYHVPIDQVHVEITESTLSHSNKMLEQGIARFKQAGFKLYLDDFGSGYSSLRVLEGTGFDVVKLDMSLLQEVEENERARVIVADTVSMVKRLALQTLCEGVETEEQFLFLKAVGCEKVQGYFFGKPMSHEEMMDHLDETADQHERPEDIRYFDSVGGVNLIDGTRSSIQGVEAAHFLGTQPFALVEIRNGQSITFLAANVAFSRFVGGVQGQDLESLVERMRADLSDIRTKALYAASKAISTHRPQQFDFVTEGHFCTLRLTHVESSEGREAFLAELLSVTRYSQFNDFRLLEQALHFLYTVFKRIDLLDLTDNTWRNIYLNVPRYNALRAGATPYDEIYAFCTTFIHPDDQARFLTFYDLDTVDARMRQRASTYLAEQFCALSDNDRFENQLFLLIPLSLGGHRQYLSCMKSFDAEGGSNAADEAGPISDDVLLNGILEATERKVFWKDVQRRFIGANKAFLDYYGFGGIEDILGKTDEDLGWGVRNKGFHDDEKRVLKGIRVLEVSGYTRRHDGQLRNMVVSKMPLQNNGLVVGLVGFFVDVGPYEEDIDDCM